MFTNAEVSSSSIASLISRFHMDPDPDPVEGNSERDTEETLSASFFEDPSLKKALQYLKCVLPENSVNTIAIELGSLSIFLKYTANRCFEYQNLADLRMRAKAVYRRAVRALKSIQEKSRLYLLSVKEKMETMLYNLEAHVAEEVKLMRSEIRQVYKIVSRSSRSHNCMSNELGIEFIGSLLENLKYLITFKVVVDYDLKKSLGALKEKLIFLRNFLMFTEERLAEYEELNSLFTHAKFAADNAAYLSYSCLVVDDMDEQMLLGLVSDISFLVQMIDPATLKGREIYIAVLQVSSELSSRPDIKTAALVDSVLKNIMELLLESVLPLKDEIEILQEELLFLRSFLMDLPNLMNTKTQTLRDLLTKSKFISLMAGSVVHSLYYWEEFCEAPEGMGYTLANLLEEIKLFKVKITKIYPKSLFPKFPSTDELGFLDYFLGNLRELSNNRIVSMRGLNLQVEQLIEELQFLRSFLGKISKQHNVQEKQKVLWTQIIDVAYKAEYIIDSLLVRSGSEEYRRLSLSENIKEIKILTAGVNKVDEKKMHDSEVDHGADISSQVPSQPTFPEMDEIVVGFEDVEESIVEDLIGGSIKRQMVAIVGMPGQGKTHLSKKIYNNPIVKHCFRIRAWCYVSHVYDRNHLLTHILSQVMESTERMNEMTDENLGEVLYKSLKGNRYLILMDDLWSVEAWNALRRSFPDDNNRSRIIFTSRFHNLDLNVSGSKIHRLRPFSDNESWQLLQRKLFQSESCPSELLEVGKQIANNCNGLPLAIVVIAGILARIDKKEHYWREVANSQSLYVVDDPEKQLMKVIDLSYKHLPDYLKPCFLYIGAFIDSNYIRVQKLIRLWVAEGFIQKVGKKCLEDIAEDNLIDLIDRSLIMIAKRRSTGDIKVCRVHDLVRDFCLEKAKEDNFLQLIKRVHTCHLPPPCIFEQLRISSNRPELFLASEAYGPHVRSLLLFGNSGFPSGATYGIVSSMCHKFKLLRVLDLECTKIWSYYRAEFPSEINSLVHLRYLAISGNFDFIPSSIANLWNLETFILKGFRRYFLPRTIWEMTKLRHLHINLCATLHGPSLDCVSRLDNLQTISTLEMRYLNQDEKEEVMEGLAHVRSLRCIFVDSYSGLATLSQLESLWVSYSGTCQWRGEFRLPSNLKKLTISEFRLPWDKISIIGKLPNLEILKLLDKAFEGEKWEMEDGDFPKLKFLKLKNLDISKWSVSGDNFPPIEQLVLQHCPQLKEIPDCLVGSTTLKKIEASGCNSLLKEIVKQIQEEQLEYGNHELQVFINHWVAKSFDKKLILNRIHDKMNTIGGFVKWKIEQPASSRAATYH